MKIYISGKIAGDPDYKEKFARAAAQLERLGATVINPATAPEGLAKLDYMRICFAEMEAVDYVVFLPDWVESAGAKLERAWCDYVGVPTADWDNFRVDMLVAYLGGREGWAWRISGLRIYDKPRALSTLCRPYECDDCDAKWATDCNACLDKGKIKRPPQSWRYVEVT